MHYIISDYLNEVDKVAKSLNLLTSPFAFVGHEVFPEFAQRNYHNDCYLRKLDHFSNILY